MGPYIQVLLRQSLADHMRPGEYVVTTMRSRHGQILIFTNLGSVFTLEGSDI